MSTFATDEPAAAPGTVRANAPITITCTSADEELTCARQRTDYATCYVDCECTNRYEKCATL